MPIIFNFGHSPPSDFGNRAGSSAIHFIDSENVHENWVGNIPFNSANDRIVIFCGPNNSMPYQKLQQLMTIYPPEKLEFVPTKAGANSMDFYIVAKLTAMIIKAPKTQYHIVSGDHGYDPLLSDIQAAGIKADRRPLQKEPEPEKAEALKEEPEPTKAASAPAKAKAVQPTPEKKTKKQKNALIAQAVREYCEPYNIKEAHTQQLIQVCQNTQYPCKKKIGSEFSLRVSKTIGTGSPAAAQTARNFMANAEQLAKKLNQIAEM